MGRSSSPSDNGSVVELVESGKLKKGDKLTVTLPSSYSDNNKKFVASGTITEDGKISYKGEQFSNLPDFHQYLKVKRASELRGNNLPAPQNPGRPTASAAAKSTTIEGITLNEYLEKQPKISNLFNKCQSNSIFDQHNPSYVSLTDEESNEEPPDASMDPFNDYDSGESLSENSLADSDNSQTIKTSVERIKNYPPQEMVSGSLDNTFESPEKNNTTGNISKTFSFEQQESESPPIPNYDDNSTTKIASSKTTIIPPQTMDMLSFGTSFLSSNSSGSWEINKQSNNNQSIEQNNEINNTLTPAKENLLKSEAKRKIVELTKKKQQNETKTNKKQQTTKSKSQTKKPNEENKKETKKRARSPVSPCFFPPKKFVKRKEDDTIGTNAVPDPVKSVKRNLFTNEENPINISDNSLPEFQDQPMGTDLDDDESSSIGVSIIGSSQPSNKLKSKNNSNSQRESQRIADFPPKKTQKQNKLPKPNEISVQNTQNSKKQKKNTKELQMALRSPSPGSPSSPDECFTAPSPKQIEIEEKEIEKPATNLTPKSMDNNSSSRDKTPSPRIITKTQTSPENVTTPLTVKKSVTPSPSVKGKPVNNISSNQPVLLTSGLTPDMNDRVYFFSSLYLCFFLLLIIALD